MTKAEGAAHRARFRITDKTIRVNSERAFAKRILPNDAQPNKSMNARAATLLINLLV